MAVPSDRNTSVKVTEKLSKYKDLEIETSRMWGMRTETIPAIKKGLETYLGRIPGQPIKLKTGYPLAPQDHGLVSALKIISKH